MPPYCLGWFITDKGVKEFSSSVLDQVQPDGQQEKEANIAVSVAQVQFTGIINVIVVNLKSTDEDLFVQVGH